MLSGEELGAALKAAMKLKGVGATEVAQAFGVTQPSVSGWVKDGRIHKKHIPTLIDYFADKVGPDHWGLPFSRDEYDLVRLYRELPLSARKAVIAAMRKAVDSATAATAGLLGVAEALPVTPHRKPQARLKA